MRFELTHDRSAGDCLTGFGYGAINLQMSMSLLIPFACRILMALVPVVYSKYSNLNTNFAVVR